MPGSASQFAVPFWSPPEVDSAIAGTILHLQAHGVLAYPTETVYGFGGAVDQESVDRLVALKRRPPGTPFLLRVAGSYMLSRLDLRLTPVAPRLGRLAQVE